LLSIPGVEKVLIWGAGEYSMRVWLDPAKMAAFGLIPSDVIDAIREQNLQVAAGAIGLPPDSSSSSQLPIIVSGRLSSSQDFEDIIVRSSQEGGRLRLSDVARVELGADRYSLRGLLNNQEAVGMQIIQDPNTSALKVASDVRAKMQEIQAGFPSGVQHQIAYDPTLFVRSSINNVVKTLLEAMILVAIVVIVFLQNWRAAVIPLIAVPVSLIGTLGIMYLAGYTLNTLSLFGLVLSIGIVVDDAIVVVENVERHLARGVSAGDAAIAAMKEVTAPILAITAVLVVIFLPTLFIDGLSGEFYRQFALTIAFSTILSAVNSLTLSPALAATLLKPHQNSNQPGFIGRKLAWFNAGFEVVSEKYARLVRRYSDLG
jgi:gold/copper resistance efflux pump